MLLSFHFFGHPVTVTGWKLVGYCGTLIFAGRWVVQLIASRKAGHPVVPPAFWYMSAAGSLMVLAYFTFGKNDSVGILGNLFPAFIGFYNLSLALRHKKKKAAEAVR
ncbi:lipid-A-disaccharide synthase N-terminal domain-containing protein [Verrucomicrobium sp. GAS474]|uniref:lipid-A-disaccharide synthase N-terminal domain-containing protein n=1 Tax=Verrucomicrobium sp. GAS474 TaxID=1882831 RepID=UPI0018D2E13C|nr:lipid-A-disaccharide synthase N-terminal domain-containing protein [Verrucomicrobium sp. GAS474]